MRKRTSRGKDRRIFAKTSQKIKKINIKPGIMRGGIRL